MGMVVDGKWQADDAYRVDAKGNFVRPQSKFRSWITPDGAPGPSGSGGFAAEAGRYHLYVAGVCPWAHRTRLYHALKSLKGVVGLSVASSKRGDNGWEFEPDDPALADPLFGSRYVYELYVRADPAYTGRATVPVLWDKRQGTIVNNESSEIIRMLNSAFDGITGNRRDFYPPALRAEIDALNDRIYAKLNNGVYRAGNAKSQEAYEEGARSVFETLDWLEARLGERRYLCGDVLTEADWRLFPTLVRFDIAYYHVMKCNLRRLSAYPHLHAYTRELYQMPGIAETADLPAIKLGYWNNPERNPTRIVPIGPIVDFSAPHGRDRLSAKAAE
ncbi:MAG: glutathione S-transferase family protein [Rhodospirillaceae bacterium]|nr:glutathione S-transferase family protein [Rhodospirillaceae bacterium]